MTKRKNIQLDLAPETLPPKLATGKIAIPVALLQQSDGANIDALMAERPGEPVAWPTEALTLGLRPAIRHQGISGS